MKPPTVIFGLITELVDAVGYAVAAKVEAMAAHDPSGSAVLHDLETSGDKLAESVVNLVKQIYEDCGNVTT